MVFCLPSTTFIAQRQSVILDVKVKNGYTHGFESYSLHFLCRAVKWGLEQLRAPNLQVHVCQGVLPTRGDIQELWVCKIVVQCGCCLQCLAVPLCLVDMHISFEIIGHQSLCPSYALFWILLVMLFAKIIRLVVSLSRILRSRELTQLLLKNLNKNTSEFQKPFVEWAEWSFWQLFHQLSINKYYFYQHVCSTKLLRTRIAIADYWSCPVPLK